jgi:hypothetical protein
VEDLGDYGEPLLWSNASTWGGILPQPGDDIEIKTNMHVIMDVYETPVLGSLEVNGKLTCPMGQPCLIHAYNLWVRQGELEIGNSTEPFDNTAIITLHGNNTQEYWAFTPQIDSGNKNFVVTGKANLYGQPRSLNATLLESAYKGNKTIRVTTGLDWVAGDEIALITTA